MQVQQPPLEGITRSTCHALYGAPPPQLQRTTHTGPRGAAVGAVALLMGLNLLEVVPLRFPSLDFDVRDLPLPPLVTAFAAGLTFALAASPCSTPILATLLAYALSLIHI